MKRYVEEAGSSQVRALLGRGLVATSRLSESEIASALARRSREGAFPRAERDRALSALRRDFATLVLVEASAAVVDRSVGLLARHVLRSADALQLASCLEFGERLREAPVFVAWDRRLCDAARAEGLAVHCGDDEG